MVQYDEVFEKVNNEMIPEIMKFLDNRREYLGIDDFVLAFAHVLSKLDINKREDELALDMIVRRLEILYKIANSCQINSQEAELESSKFQYEKLFNQTLNSWANASLLNYDKYQSDNMNWDLGKHEIANKFNEETIGRLLDLARSVDKDHFNIKNRRVWYNYLDEKIYRTYMKLDNGNITDLWRPDKDEMEEGNKVLLDVVELYSAETISEITYMLSGSQIFSIALKDSIRYTSFFVSDTINPYELLDSIESLVDDKGFVLDNLEIEWLKDNFGCYHFIWTIYTKKKKG